MIDYNKFKCKYLEDYEIENIIEDLIIRYKIHKEEPVDVELLINDIGLKLDIRPLEYKYDAFLKINRKTSICM